MDRFGSYSSLSDDFYVNMNLSTEMELPHNRETILHFFERVQKKYPTMRNFYCRDKGDFVLEEDKDQGHYRWGTIEPRRVSSGHVNPTSVEEPSNSTSSCWSWHPTCYRSARLDCEALDVMFGFDFTYRGNHSQLVAEALGLSPALEKMLEVPGATVINYEPTVTLALDDQCRRQCR